MSLPFSLRGSLYKVASTFTLRPFNESRPVLRIIREPHSTVREDNHNNGDTRKKETNPRKILLLKKSEGPHLHIHLIPFKFRNKK